MADTKEPKTVEPKTAPPPPSTSTVTSDVDVILTINEPLQGIALALDDLGVPADPASVIAISNSAVSTTIAETGSGAILDPARPPVVDGADLLVFFSPQPVSGTYSFRFTFTWVEDLTPVVPKPLKDGKYDGVEEGAAKKK